MAGTNPTLWYSQELSFRAIVRIQVHNKKDHVPPRPSTKGRLAQRSDYATIQNLTGFQGIRRCETVLQY